MAGHLPQQSPGSTLIRIWNAESGQQTNQLESHTASVHSVAFASDDRLLASKSSDGTVRLWRCDTWNVVAVLTEPASDYWPPGLAFHPTDRSVLATLGEKDTIIRIWDLDAHVLLKEAEAPPPTVHYANAKVVLVGDTGVGKTCLGRALMGEPFVAQESTHGRRVWIFERHVARLGSRQQETREILLWDLAGQAGYRLVHQLHLSEAAIALMVFDARSETDPFAGVRHWDKALRQAQRVGGTTQPLKKLLVAARTDRGGIAVSSTRVSALLHELGCEGYFETSARQGYGTAELV